MSVAASFPAETMRAPDGTEIVLRSCEGYEELEACVRLQIETWGYDDGDVIPRRMFKVAQRVGGQAIGAFDPGGELIGFAMAIPGMKPKPTLSAIEPRIRVGHPDAEVGESEPTLSAIQPRIRVGHPGNGVGESEPTLSAIEPRIRVGHPDAEAGHPGDGVGHPEQVPYLHSHMLAVTPRYRNAGLGRRLKLYQRAEAVSRGIRLMEWTFDPLEIKNAHLNIHKLGVIVRTYSPNFYGVSSSRLQAGLPTDRLHAEWWMESERVKAILSGSTPTPPQIQETIMVPKAIATWKAESVSRAQALQSENREKFLAAFARGLAVVGFETDPEGNGIYELARLHQPDLGVL